MGMIYQFHYAAGLLKRYGFRGLLLKVKERQGSPMLQYTKRWQEFMPDEKLLKQQKNAPLSYAPLISIVVPAYETAESFLCELLESVTAQTYKNWELCIADGSRSDRVQEIVKTYQEKDSRIRCVKLKKNGGISENTNEGFAMAKGEYIAMMDHDDLLTANAIYEMVFALGQNYSNEERTNALLYSDEDKIAGEAKVHSRVHFKPGYNQEFLRRNNYFCHFLMFSRELLEKTGGLRREYDGAQDYDFVLRCVEAGAKVVHVPRVLYHWRIHEGSTALNSADKSYAFDAGAAAITEHLKRMGEPARVRVTPNLGVYQVLYELSGEYKVSITAKDKAILERAREMYGVGKRTGRYRLFFDYIQAKELTDTVIEKAQGDYILTLSENLKAIPAGCVEKFLGFCQHGNTAIAAAKLIDGKKKIVSCGFLYEEDGPVPLLSGFPADYKGYFLHAVIPQNVSGASLDCAMIRKDAWRLAGGLQNSFLNPVLRDADFCFRVQDSGFLTVVTPEVTAQVQDRAAGAEPPEGGSFEKERDSFQKKWKKKLKLPDPYYNENLSGKLYHSYEMKEQI